MMTVIMVKIVSTLRFLCVLFVIWKEDKSANAAVQHSQALIQTGDELRYLVDGISIQLTEGYHNEDSSNGYIDNDLPNSADVIRFDPPFLDFHNHPIGMPTLAKVIVSNLEMQSTIHLYSISGSTTHFHCSFFQDKVIPAGGNTSFDVVFLGREEGQVKNVLYIHTSIGSFRYQVAGLATPNPYRLRPFLGARVPVNAVFAPVIKLHNPHNSTLQVTEMYSSGGDLHLELPDDAGADDAPKHLWEIPPYETRPVMRASFVAKVESNHSAYIRIKTNSTSNDYLILPFEVEVSSAPGLYTTTDVLQFGVLTGEDKPQTLSLSLLNHGHKIAQVTNVYSDPSNSAVNISFRSIKLPPDLRHPIWIADITLDPSKVLHSENLTGKIIVKTKQGQFKLAVPYQASILHGSLVPVYNTTKFQIKPSGNPSRQNISITNTFNVAVVIFRAEMASSLGSCLFISSFVPLIIKPWQTSVVCELEYSTKENVTTFTTYLILHTNLSLFQIPVVAFSGKLTKIFPLSKGKLELGTLYPSERRETYLVLRNDNPVEVVLRSWRPNLPQSLVELVGVKLGDISDTVKRKNFSKLAKTLILKPSYFAILRLSVVAPDNEGSFLGEVIIETQYEILKVPFSLRSSHSRILLYPNDATFDIAFPGKISSLNVSVLSSFTQPQIISSVEVIPQDSQVLFQPASAENITLMHHVKTCLGTLFFDPEKECKENCYLRYTAAEEKKWIASLSLAQPSAAVDEELYSTYWKKWENLKINNKNKFNITIQLDSLKYTGFLLHIQASLKWPSLVDKKGIKFALTQVGNFTVSYLTLRNPSSYPLVVQLLSSYDYPNLDIIKLLPLKNKLNFDNFFTNGSESPISIAYKETVLGVSHYEQFDFVSHKNTITLVIAPGLEIRVEVLFKPLQEKVYNCLIVIRNNLTILETVNVEGEAIKAQLKFGNRNPNGDIPLNFELTEKHLHECSVTTPRFQPPLFTVKRTFIARNNGKLPIYINGFDIGGTPCEGFGFRVLDCEAFRLMPNESKKIDIAFTPDFTLSQLLLSLTLHSSLGEGGKLLFPLLATVPPHLLVPCGLILPRPWFEEISRYIALGIALCFLLGVFGVAYMEADRILRFTVVAVTTAMSTASATSSGQSSFSANLPGMNGKEKGKMFDLKTIASSASRDISVKSGDSDQYINCANSAENNKLLRKSSVESLLSNSSTLTRRKKDQSLSTVQSQFISSLERTYSKPINLNRSSFEKIKVPSFSSSSEHEAENERKKNTLRKSNSVESGSPTQTKKVNDIIQAKLDDDISFAQAKNLERNSERKSKLSKRNYDIGENVFEEKEKVILKHHEHILSQEDSNSSSTDSSSLEYEITEKSNVLKHKRAPVNNSINVEMNNEDKALDLGGKVRKTLSSQSKNSAIISNSLVQSRIELPYKLKNARKMESFINNNESKWRDPSSKLSLAKSKPVKKSIIFNRGNRGSYLSSDWIDHGKESPPPVWDHPRSFPNGDDAFTELANQTASFALKEHGHIRQDKGKLGMPCSPERFPNNSGNFSSATGNGLSFAEMAKTSTRDREIGHSNAHHLGPIGQKPAVTSLRPLPLPMMSWGSSQLPSPILGSPVTPTSVETPNFFETSGDHYQKSKLGRWLPSAKISNSDSIDPGQPWKLNPVCSLSESENVHKSILDDEQWHAGPVPRLEDCHSWSNDHWTPSSKVNSHEDSFHSSNQLHITSNSTWDSFLGGVSSGWSSMPWSSNNATLSNKQSSPSKSDEDTFESNENSTIGGFDPFSSFNHFWRPQMSSEQWNDTYYSPPSTPGSCGEQNK